MSDEISVILSWFAGYSNFYSVLSVLVCFCIMVIFILRLNGDNLLSTPATHYNTPKEQPMTKLYNPFSIQISDGKLSSLKDGLHINVSVKRSCQMEIFWGVDIKTFQKEIHKPVRDVHVRLKEKETFDGSYLHKVNLELPLPLSIRDIKMSGLCVREQLFRLFCNKLVKYGTQVLWDRLWRGRHPDGQHRVLCLEHNFDILEDIAQFTIIHLKDSVCTLDSHIVYQFVKTNRNNLLSLQPIYLSSSEQEFSGATRSTAQSQTNQHSSNGNTSVNCNSQETNQGTDGTDSTCTEKTSEVTEENSSANSKTRKKINDIEHEEHAELTLNPENIDDDVFTCDNENDIDSGVKENKNLDDDNNEDNDNAGLDETNTCIICQNAVIYYTLLPCRHACVCVSCVRLVDRCPMCRSYIDAFFRLYDQVYTGLDSQTLNNVPTRTVTVWEAINERLNEMLGFA